MKVMDEDLARINDEIEKIKEDVDELRDKEVAPNPTQEEIKKLVEELKKWREAGEEIECDEDGRIKCNGRGSAHGTIQGWRQEKSKDEMINEEGKELVSWMEEQGQEQEMKGENGCR